MKRKKIENALENIDSAYIESAANYHKKHSPETGILKWGAIAASFTVILLAGALFMRGTIPSSYSPSTEPSPGISSSRPLESSDVTNSVYWSESTIENAVLEKRKLSIIEDPVYKSYVSLRVIDSAYVGEKLGETEIRSFWRNYLLNEDTDMEFLRAEIYAIKDISPEFAVCIRYLDEGDALTTTHYYTYINPNHKPQNFGEFYQTFALDFSAKNGVTLLYPSEEGTVYQNCDIDGNILIRSLTSLTNAETQAVTVWNDDSALENEKEFLKNCSAQAHFFGEISPGGTFSCRIYDNGYLYIRINKTISYLFKCSDMETDSVFRLIDEHKIEKNTERTEETVSGEPLSSEAVIPE